MATLTEKELAVNENLKRLMSKQCQIESKMRSIRNVMVELNTICDASKNLNAQIEHTAQLTKSVSEKVRCLDLAKNGASECQQRVNDLIDLQLCSQGVLMAIRDDDFEKGASHVARFLAMDQQLLQRTADDVQGTNTSVSDAIKTLEDATKVLAQKVLRQFDDAAARDDLASVERFFKILPQLGQHEVGISKFARYVCIKLDKKLQKEFQNANDNAKAEMRLAVVYVDMLTALLENFARVVEVNQPIIEAHYGMGYLLDLVAILQTECDAQVKKLILEFNKHRQITLRAQQIKQYQRPANTNTSGSVTQGLGNYQRQRGASMDKLNPKDIDNIIAEITVMHSRIELYFRFMRRRITQDIEASATAAANKQLNLEKLEELIRKSDLNREMQEILSLYLLFERYFLEESVLRAIALDAFEPGQECSSMVGDVFFILRKCLRRSQATNSLSGTCAVINIVVSCLDVEFVNALRAQLKSGYPSGYIDLAQAYSAIQNSLQQGKLQSSDADKLRNNFLVQLNNADMSVEFIETLWKTMNDEIKRAFPGMSSVEAQILNSCMTELQSVRDSLKACVDVGMQQLYSSAIRPRLGPWVDHFLSYNHVLNEEELAVYEAGETFIQYLIMHIDGLLNSFKHVLSARNYDALVSILATDVTTHLERSINKTAYNRLGGLVLDKEVRALSAYLTSATSWSVRDKLTRLTQITTLLNLENVAELKDYWHSNDNSEMPAWRLTSKEVKNLLTLRTDFRMEDIKRLNL